MSREKKKKKAVNGSLTNVHKSSPLMMTIVADTPLNKRYTEIN